MLLNYHILQEVVIPRLHLAQNQTCSICRGMTVTCHHTSRERIKALVGNAAPQPMRGPYDSFTGKGYPTIIERPKRLTVAAYPKDTVTGKPGQEIIPTVSNLEDASNLGILVTEAPDIFRRERTEGGIKTDLKREVKDFDTHNERSIISDSFKHLEKNAALNRFAASRYVNLSNKKTNYDVCPVCHLESTCKDCRRNAEKFELAELTYAESLRDAGLCPTCRNPLHVKRAPLILTDEPTTHEISYETSEDYENLKREHLNPLFAEKWAKSRKLSPKTIQRTSGESVINWFGRMKDDIPAQRHIFPREESSLFERRQSHTAYADIKTHYRAFNDEVTGQAEYALYDGKQYLRVKSDSTRKDKIRYFGNLGAELVNHCPREFYRILKPEICSCK